jgi:hypothetical protein
MLTLLSHAHAEDKITSFAHMDVTLTISLTVRILVDLSGQLSNLSELPVELSE